MTSQDFINLLAHYLRPIVETNGGKWFLAQDPTTPFVVLAASAFSGWACILSFTGAQPLGEELEGAMNAAECELWIGRPLDLNADPGAWLKGATGADAKALLARLDLMQQKALTIAFLGEQADRNNYSRFLGSEAVMMPVTGVPLRAWKFRVAWDMRFPINPADYRFLNAPSN